MRTIPPPNGVSRIPRSLVRTGEFPIKTTMGELRAAALFPGKYKPLISAKSLSVGQFVADDREAYVHRRYDTNGAVYYTWSMSEYRQF